jgi:splicing factor 3B subunit 2
LTKLSDGIIDEEEEESDDEDEEEEEEATDAAPVDGLQTPSGIATPSGMASVVSTVAAGLETPDFLELRKTSTAPVRDEGGNRQLYSVLPEKQTGVRGLMGSERGYDVGGVVGASVPVLGEERGNKVNKRFPQTKTKYYSLIRLSCAAQGRRCGCFARRERA